MLSSSFGEKQLKKFGWTQGDGIGKNNQGIVDPIKASLKFNSNGLGYDIAEQFTVSWWEHMYNHAADKVNPTNDKKSNDDDKKQKDDEKSGKKKLIKTFDNKNVYYARFQKAGTLKNGNEESEDKEQDQIEEKEEEDYDKKGKKIVSDEDLYKICEGRTAHKGARHGIKMNGKLARIMEQENQALEEMIKKSSKKHKLTTDHDTISQEQSETTTKIDDNNEDDLTEETEVVKKKKKKSKKTKHQDE